MMIWIGNIGSKLGPSYMELMNFDEYFMGVWNFETQTYDD